MPVPQNIVRFNEIVAKTFSLLYESFPLARPLSIEADFGIERLGKLYDEMFRDEAYGEFSNSPEGKSMDFIRSSILWLRDEGFITCSEGTDPTFFAGACLTSKGFTVLSAMPSSLQPKGQTVGEFFLEAFKSGVKDKLSETVKEAIAIGINLLS